MADIKIFLLILSIIFLLRYTIEFLIKLLEEEPSPMKISDISKLFIYLSLSYIITYMFIT